MSQIQYAVRLIGLTAGAGVPPWGMPYVNTLKNNLDFLKEVYFPTIYKGHDCKSQGINTIHPVANGVVDDVKDINYFQIMKKMYTKAQYVYDSGI